MLRRRRAVIRDKNVQWALSRHSFRWFPTRKMGCCVTIDKMRKIHEGRASGALKLNRVYPSRTDHPRAREVGCLSSHE